jgi:DNA repair protein RadC
MFRGTIDGASVYPREVVKEALRSMRRRSSFRTTIRAEPEPSAADRAMTRSSSRRWAWWTCACWITSSSLAVTTSFAERGLL